MKWMSGLLLLAGCSDPLPPEPPRKPKALPVIATSEAPPPAPLPVPPPAPPPPPPAPAPPAMAFLPAAPSGPAAATQSPAFHFRTMDASTPLLIVNGRRHAGLPVMWWVSEQTEFDPRIPVPAWPPEGAAYRGRADWISDDGARSSCLELHVAGGRFTDLDALRKRWPHLDPAEQVLFVKGHVQGRAFQGALRIQVRGADGAVYRYVTYDPSGGDEDPQSARLKRTLWFERD